MMNKKNIIVFFLLLILIPNISYFNNQCFAINPNDFTVLPAVISENTILKKEKNPYLIDSDVTINKNVILTIMSGVKIHIKKDYAIYVYGAINAIGKTNSRIVFKEFKENGFWKGINFIDNNIKSILLNTDVYNGIIWSKNSKLKFTNSSFIYLNRKLESPLLYLEYSDIMIDNCIVTSNYTGDAIVIKSGENISVTNSVFTGTGDAIEYSLVNNGLIKNNIIYNSIDDCIDINGSKNLEISGNVLKNALDKGISIGNNLAIKSENINIFKNIIVSCKYAIAVKGNSKVNFTNNTLYGNGTGIYCYQKTDGKGGGIIEVKNTIFSNCNTDFKIDKYSSINISFSLSDSDSLLGENNLFSNPKFIDPDSSNFNLNNDSPCIDAGDPNSDKDIDGSPADIGALSYFHSLKKIVINEINYNSSYKYDSGDWIEIFNNDDNKIDLSDWQFVFDDNSKFIFPKNSDIENDSFLVIVREKNKFPLIFPNIKNKIGYFDYDLSNEGGFIKLIDSYGRLVDNVHYASTYPWPEKANGDGSTLELIDLNKDNNIAENWKASINHGTPGKINSVTTNVNENISDADIMKNHFVIFPNPTTGDLIIKFLNNSTIEKRFKVFDIQGREKKIKNITNFNNNSYSKLTLGKLQQGVYFLVINIGNRIFSQKFYIIK